MALMMLSVDRSTAVPGSRAKISATPAAGLGLQELLLGLWGSRYLVPASMCRAKQQQKQQGRAPIRQQLVPTVGMLTVNMLASAALPAWNTAINLCLEGLSRVRPA
jgi:hypothetical protein